MSNLILYGIAASSYVRTCRLALAEKGVDYELDPAMPHSDAQLARHPWGQVPALTHGDFQLYETLAITRYIDETFAGPALQPADAAGRALMSQWISAINADVYRPVTVDIVIQRIVVPMRGGNSDEERIAGAIPAAQKAIAVLDKALANSVYLVGNDLTLADLFLLPIMNYLAMTPDGKDLLAEASNIKRWQQAMETRASAKVLQES